MHALLKSIQQVITGTGSDDDATIDELISGRVMSQVHLFGFAGSPQKNTFICLVHRFCPRKTPTSQNCRWVVCDDCQTW